MVTSIQTIILIISLKGFIANFIVLIITCILMDIRNKYLFVYFFQYDWKSIFLQDLW
jgi:hypothetical protein